MQIRRDYSTRENADGHNTVVMPNRVRRSISWGAILAGAIIALVVMFALYMLGLAIGAASINPAQEINSVTPALGVGTVIWLAASTVIGLFLGGVTAGRMSGTTDEGDGALHGLVTWAVVTAVSLFMLTTAVGGIISGVSSAFASIVSTAGQAAGEVAPEVAQALNLQDETLLAIQNEAQAFVAAVTEVEGQAGQPITQMDAPPTIEQLQFNREIQAFLSNPADITDADRDKLAESIAGRTDLTAQEARVQIDRWEAFYMQVREEAEATARDVGQAVTNAIVVLAGAIFSAMIVGAFAAGAGGYIGTEERMRPAQTAVVETTPYTLPNASPIQDV